MPTREQIEARSISLGCPSKYGTHLCSQLNLHNTQHYCACGGAAWRTGDKAPLSAYNMKLMSNTEIMTLAKEMGIR